jgi:hypothetical protein
MRLAAEGETLRATPDHPFWVVSGEELESRPRADHLPWVEEGSTLAGRWVFAGHLRAGDELFLFPDRFARLESVDREMYDGLVYNLEVDALHNYAVGAFGALAHNFQVPGEGAARVSDRTYPTGRSGGQPTGSRATNKPNADADFKRGIARENESADTLSKKGYKVEQNPDVASQTTNPDFRIEGHLFDNYAPTTSDARSIVDQINKKVANQAPRIVLNLADTGVTRSQLRQALQDYGSAALQELIVIDKLGNIVKFLP